MYDPKPLIICGKSRRTIVLHRVIGIQATSIAATGVQRGLLDAHLVIFFQDLYDFAQTEVWSVDSVKMLRRRTWCLEVLKLSPGCTRTVGLVGYPCMPKLWAQIPMRGKLPGDSWGSFSGANVQARHCGKEHMSYLFTAEAL